MADTLPAVAAVNLPAARMETMVAQRQTVMEAVEKGMTKDVHYGTVPGCGNKPTCLKPGAEMLCLLFGLRPQFTEQVNELGGGHKEIVSSCSLYSPNGQLMGQGIGSCSTMESKYRYRNAAVKCPACGKEAIIKGKQEYGGGWICFAKKGGCGAKYPDGAKEIEGQERGKVENPDIADQYNTVRKMAKKRAHIDATLTTTGASEFFTQDVEDFPEYSIQPAAREELKPEPKPARVMPANERIEPDLMPSEYKIQTPSSKMRGKSLQEIHAADPRWFPATVQPNRLSGYSQRDQANIRAFWDVMKPQNGNSKSAQEQAAEMDAAFDAMDAEGMFDGGAK